MNENESRREDRMNRKILTFLDQRIEEILSNERLTGAGKANAAVSQSQESLISLSQERRALLRLLSNRETRSSEE